MIPDAALDRPETAHQGTSAARVGNIASHLPLMASRVPDHPAIIVPAGGQGTSRARYRSVTFAELEATSNRYANGLLAAGLSRGTRTLVMVRPGVEFIALIFALFKIGAVPILIDPGMGVRRMLACIRNVAPEALIGLPAAQAVRVLRRGFFEQVRLKVTVGRRWFWGGPTLAELHDRSKAEFDMAATSADEVAAILFTSGSTGPAKGVVYRHGMFDAQVRWIQACYGIEPGEVDLSTFPLFALFCPAMGMTSVIPDMDASRPGRADPVRIIEAVTANRATSAFGSPALWNRVSRYCLERGIQLPTLRRILIAGAPVPWTLLDRLHRMLDPSATVATPYGATEALPVASITGREVLEECAAAARQGAGTCVGRPLPGIRVRIIRVDDGPLAEWSDELALPDGQIGEIAVSGEVVTREYADQPRATALAKLRQDDKIWHRMGDLGYLDERGRLWFCGRKAHRVITASGTLCTVPCEAVFNEHADVFRSALVGVGPAGRQRPVIVVEPEANRFPSGRRAAAFRQELLALARANERTREIGDVLFHRSLPVDVRHNAKINRELLACRAAERLP